MMAEFFHVFSVKVARFSKKCRFIGTFQRPSFNIARQPVSHPFDRMALVVSLELARGSGQVDGEFVAGAAAGGGGYLMNFMFFFLGGTRKTKKQKDLHK